MSPAKESRKGVLGFMDRAIAFVDGLRGIVMILAALSVGGASGTLLASNPDTATQVHSLRVRMDSMETWKGRMERRQMEMFSAQVEADTALRAVLERRAADRREAASGRANTEKLFNDIIGGLQ